MLMNLISSGFERDAIIMVLLSIPVILLALCVHECAHGFVAKLMGDPTAYNLGRLTLNPTKHLDPMGALMMFLFGFGWAKPVPINTRYFKNPKWGMCVSALAGPVSNVLCSYIFYFAYQLLITKCITFEMYLTGEIPVFLQAVILLCAVGYQLNLSLAIFNLLPIPPLDGSRILFVLLPSKYYFKIMEYEQYISLALILLLVTDVLDKPLYTILYQVEAFFAWTTSWMV